MSRLDEMVGEMCPDGVEYVRLGDMSQVKRGRRLTRSQLTTEGEYPVFHGGLQPIGFYHEYNREADTVMVLNVGDAGTVRYSDRRFWSSDGCFCIEKNPRVLDRFLYHYLKKHEYYLKSKVRVAAIPTLDKGVLERFMIPVPPLEVQCEVVRVLDKFEADSLELIALLEREIAARKKQYAYYRDKLLTFNQKTQ